MTKKGWISISVIFFVLLFDQLLKIHIKTSPLSTIHNLFFIDFVENNGMAFGVELPGVGGKYALTTFRLIASGVIAFLIRRMIIRQVAMGIVVGFSMILAGALGNIIDSLFYGIIFDYAPLMQGRVVDMLHFNLFDFYWPEWIPWIGGNYFQFFAPVFNIADSSITTGIAYLLIFHRKFFKENQF